jgi:hypothetical protein
MQLISCDREVLETMSSIFLEGVQRKVFMQNSANEAYIVQSMGDRMQYCGRTLVSRCHISLLAVHRTLSRLSTM